MTFWKDTYNMAHSILKINSVPELNIRAITEFFFPHIYTTKVTQF